MINFTFFTICKNEINYMSQFIIICSDCQGFGEQGKNNSCRGTSQILKTGEHLRQYWGEQGTYKTNFRFWGEQANLFQGNR